MTLPLGTIMIKDDNVNISNPILTDYRDICAKQSNVRMNTRIIIIADH